MNNYLVAFLIVPLVFISCTINNEIQIATFAVGGMDIRGGILWMGWPINIGKALDGLIGIQKHSFNQKTRTFTVNYYASKLSQSDIVKSVEKAGDFNVLNWTNLEKEW